MVKAESDFIQRLTQDVFSWEYLPTHYLAHVNFKHALENLWVYYAENGGRGQDFIAIMDRLAHQISNSK